MQKVIEVLRHMLTKEQMLPLLAEASPSFADKWEEHKREYEDEEDFLPYTALGKLAHHLINLEKQNETSEFKDIFEVVEQLHLDGEHYVREAATIGLLESLQNILGEDSAKFEKYLKPTSLKWWDELNKFWDGQIQFVGQTINTKN